MASWLDLVVFLGLWAAFLLVEVVIPGRSAGGHDKE